MIEYRQGDATQPPGDGPKIIGHVCNDLGQWGSGFVVAVSRRWPAAEREYRRWHAANDGSFLLGSTQLVEVAPSLWVANMIGQHGIRVSETGEPPIRYEALSQCLAQLADHAAAKKSSVHMPRIGCGLAGGEWSRVEKLVEGKLISRGIPVAVYDLPAKVGWELWRQDDGGNRFLIDTYASEAEALRMMKVYEDRGHKQTYWVKERKAGQ